MNVKEFKILVKKLIKEEMSLQNNLYFTSKYGLQTKEFEDFLNKNNIGFKKSDKNIFNIPTINYDLVVDNKTKRIILDFIKNNRLSHITKTGDHFIQVEKEKSLINPKYTHFAILKSNNKIINGWEYGDIDVEDLKSDKEHYFYFDIKDLDFKPKDVKILTKKALERININPFDANNWHKFI